MLFLPLIIYLMNAITLFNFDTNSNLDNWQVVNDVVMGGKSSSKFLLDSDGNGVFKGSVSLDNNGGFCSVQYSLTSLSLQNRNSFVIRLKGDGKKYQFRAKAKKSDSHSYIYEFQTAKDWQTITIPIADMHAAYRGNKLNIPNYDGTTLEEIAFLIGNKKRENFELILDKIEVK
jgi:hypothetical protein